MNRSGMPSRARPSKFPQEPSKSPACRRRWTMFRIELNNAEQYLRDRGWIDHREAVRVSPLPGGVSNQVLYVSRPDQPGADFVLKQARARLRTPDPWFASIE